MSDANKKLMESILGALMVQVSMYRFLVKENVIDRDRLLAFLAERGEAWGKTATAEALFPLATVMSVLAAKEEPAFPQTVH